LPDSHRYKNTINDSEPMQDAVATGETVGNATTATTATSATAATSEATVGTAGDDCGSKKLASCLIGEVMAYRDFGDPAA
jgi:hypothetical protein